MALWFWEEIDQPQQEHAWERLVAFKRAVQREYFLLLLAGRLK